MDRARTELIERAEILARFPEFACLTHRVPFVTKRQNELLLGRLARNAARGQRGCIIWMGNVNNDCYGRTSLWITTLGQHRPEYVHRLVWLMKSGKAIPHFREVAHDCDNPTCLNPAHLQLQRMPDNRRKSAENTNRKKARAAVRARFARSVTPPPQLCARV